MGRLNVGAGHQAGEVAVERGDIGGQRPPAK
jgi:hypothetical protein